MKAKMPKDLYIKYVLARVEQLKTRITEDYLNKKITMEQYAGATNNEDVLKGEAASELSKYVEIAE